MRVAFNAIGTEVAAGSSDFCQLLPKLHLCFYDKAWYAYKEFIYKISFFYEYYCIEYSYKDFERIKIIKDSLQRF